MRIGLFGGTFNPIHLGHLRSAVEVGNRFGLDRIFFIPAALPPHKSAAGIAPAEKRMKMVRLAVAGRPGLAATDVELLRSGPSFTIDTVSEFQDRLPADSRLFFIVGLDAFLEIDTWRAVSSLFSRIAFIVMSRPSSHKKSAAATPDHIEKFMRQRISSDYRYDPGHARFVHPSLKTVHLCPVTLMDISASKIRKLVAEERPIGFLVPEAVEVFIYEQGLYQ